MGVHEYQPWNQGNISTLTQALCFVTLSLLLFRHLAPLILSAQVT